MSRLRLIATSLVALLLAACTGTSPTSSLTSTPGASVDPGLVVLAGSVIAGPVCPVQREPPDSACADRPVAGATLIVRATGGEEVARAVSDADGRFRVTLVPGSYRVEPQPVDGLLGTPSPQEVVVAAGTGGRSLSFAYDTGIR